MGQNTHAPTIRLAAARMRRDRVAESCPHWDYESDSAGHACCDDLADAERELHLARAAVAALDAPQWSVA